MKRDVYVYTGNKGASVRQMTFTRGGKTVVLDFNREREVVGVEVINATKVTLDGKNVQSNP